MSRTKGIIETKPRKKMILRGSRDGEAYMGRDSGCEKATKFLNRQSLCLRCPFPECLLVRKI